MEDYLPIPQISHMPFIFQNNAKCTYFQPKIYLRVPKMYLVNNVLENQIWAVPLLNMGKPGSSHFRDPPLILEESPLKSEAVLIKY